MHCPQCGRILPDLSVAACPSCSLHLDDAIFPKSSVQEAARAGQSEGDFVPTAAAPLPPDPGMAPSAADGRPEFAAPVQPLPYTPHPLATPPQPMLPWRGGRIALIVALTVIAVLLICGGSGLGFFAYTQSHRLLSALPRATTVGTPTPTPTEFVIYQNSLAAKASGWADDKYCSFRVDGYHILGNYICFVPIGPLASVDISADVQQVGGSMTQAYGLSFRYERPDTTDYGDQYVFGIDMRGRWAVWKVVSNQVIKLADFAPSTAIKTGAGTTNRLRARAVDEQFDFFINDTFVGHVDDSRFTGGYVGTTGYVGVAGCIGCDVLVSNIVVSEVSQL